MRNEFAPQSQIHRDLIVPYTKFFPNCIGCEKMSKKHLDTDVNRQTMVKLATLSANIDDHKGIYVVRHAENIKTHDSVRSRNR